MRLALNSRGAINSSILTSQRLAARCSFLSPSRPRKCLGPTWPNSTTVRPLVVPRGRFGGSEKSTGRQVRIHAQDALALAVRSAGYHFAVPLDFSHKNGAGQSWGIRGSFEEQFKDRSDLREGFAFDNLPSITARYICELKSCRDRGGTSQAPAGKAQHNISLLSEREVQFLKNQRYTEEDVADWARILTNESSEASALLLLQLCNPNDGKRTKPVPFFVLSFFLRRENIPAQALRLLLIHAADRVSQRHNPKFATGSYRGYSHQNPYYPALELPSHIILVNRLIRHARKVWPAGLCGIARLFTRYFQESAGPYQIKHESRVYYGRVFNQMLHLLGLPSSQTPFIAIPHHQRAQFQLIRKMSEFSPPLLLDRDGYRAVTRVQIAHKKSIPERQWAIMKSKSWPPWKQDKLGVDADIGTDHGMSRARETLTKLVEAGYGLENWEKASMVLSGWDTDQSPTIQTRAIVNLKRGSSPTSHMLDDIEPDKSGDIWAARIQATRTVDEAWASFLRFRDSGCAPSENVYHAMARKLVYERHRVTLGQATQRRSLEHARTAPNSRMFLPGDGPEVADPPSDPRERVYVRTPPPDLASLLQQARIDGIRPRGRFLTLLIRHASSIEECVSYLQSSNLSGEVVLMLAGSIRPTSDLLSQVPTKLLAAFVECLTRSSHPLPHDLDFDSILRGRDIKLPNGMLNCNLHAFRLVLLAKPCHRGVWHALVSALTEEINRLRTYTMGDRSIPRDVYLWNFILIVIAQMKKVDIEVDFSLFRLLCIAYSKALLASRGWLASNNHHKLREESDKELDDGLNKLKGMFKRLVTIDKEHSIFDPGPETLPEEGLYYKSAMDILPRLTETPNPAHLHAFIRTLGAARDFEGLRDLTRWMVEFAPEINAVKKEAMNGNLQIRNCLIALRVYLEGDLVRSLVADKGEQVGEGLKRNLDYGQAPEELIQEVFELVEEVDEWQGWPSDEEVDNYCMPQALPTKVIRKV